MGEFLWVVKKLFLIYWYYCFLVVKGVVMFLWYFFFWLFLGSVEGNNVSLYVYREDYIEEDYELIYSVICWGFVLIFFGIYLFFYWKVSFEFYVVLSIKF